MGLKAFSVVSDPEHPGARRLSRSAKFWGWDHSFIIKRDHLDLKPPYIVWRPHFRAEQLGWLEATRLFNEEYLFYVDGWDTVFTGPPQELGELHRGRLTFGGDTVLYPEGGGEALANLHPRVGLEEFRYINAGSAWGHRDLFGELAEDFLSHSPNSVVNQSYFTYRFLFERGVGRQRLAIDSRAEVSLNIMLVQKRFFKFDHNRVTYLPTGTRPLVVHVPGLGVSAGPNAVALPRELEALYAEER